MKKLFFVIAVVMLVSFWACERETIQENQSTIVDESNLETVDDKYYGGFCFYYIEYGFKWAGNCYSHIPGICEYRRICIPKIIYKPCQLIPCWPEILDPWIIYEKIDPREFLSIRDKLELDIDVRQGAIPFAMNEAVLGLQFYEENRLLSSNGKDYIYTLKQDLVLDKESVEQLGLRGNVVKAGEYPVVFNRENKTFNALLGVEKDFRQ
ncbi:hypothetical protein [Aquimarina sp. MMG016]|uniref:hypothetical protein n=1 Tax=Aquimarina sp. MMG016 TaxID=2822690 RepID=UPI001B3A775D|nr:hypothetical protein [Aquimarina sp. MMG016]MBQ4822093.1 hypothetical protein [Aquimarina sp. MMG016]